jgi:competence protein ComEC
MTGVFPARLSIIGFAAGVTLVAWLAELPGVIVLLLAGAGALLASLAAFRAGGYARLGLVFMAAATLGVVWSAGCAHRVLGDRLAPDLEGRDLVLVGVVASLPQRFERGVRFDFVPETARTLDGATVAVPDLVTLAWYGGSPEEAQQTVAPVRAGERWRITVRLKRPHGNANPHGFDYEAWLAERGIGATGYVRPRGPRERLTELVSAPRYLVARAREKVRDRFLAALPDARYAGVLAALAVGDQQAIVGQDWDVFTRTGVGHLMSISGLHVTMVSGLVAALAAFLWRRSERLTLALPAQRAAAVAGALAAFGYCLLAGFQVPAQRTLYMVAVVALALWLGRVQSVSRVLALSLLIVLLVDPLAVVSAGFWLSFGAVAAILYAVGDGTKRLGWVRGAVRTQWAVTIGLAPLAVALFQQVSIVSPLANAVAIPVVSFVVTPLALIAAAVPIEAPLIAGHVVLSGLMTVLDRLAALPGAVWQQHAPAPWTVALAIAGIVWMLAPRGVPVRWVGALLLLPLFLLAPKPLPPGAAEVAVLDVGQGLAVVVRTATRTLVYDAGPRYSVEADAGNRVVVPYLRATAASDVDMLVVSHDDNDHAGGAASVLRGFPGGTLMTSVAPESPLLTPSEGPRLPCRRGGYWVWDGVRFEMLHPVIDAARPSGRANDASCVLAITAGGLRVLLTGDIEADAERELLASAREALPADAMLVPHHGSRTSSTQDWIAAVAPKYAVVAAGYRNRFGHPKEDVLERYLARGTTVLRTDHDGAIVFRLEAAQIRVSRTRDARRRWWTDQPGEAG